MYTTNYTDTFIAIAEDSPVDHAEIPAEKDPKTVARIEYEMLVDAPYRYTSDDVLYAANGERRGLSRDEFFAKGQACFRASPLAKRYGWGVHSDAEGRIAIYAAGSPEYMAMFADPALKQLKAMRSSRR